MIREAEIAAYLARAKEADDMANKATNPKALDAWRNIAQSYRLLAGILRGQD